MKERKLTDKEERIAQGLPDAEFKKRYGKDWKSVKIATATKMAKMKESTIRNFIKSQIKHLAEKNNDEPSDAEYDQMAKDAEQDDLMRKAAELGYIDLEEIGNFHDPRMSSGNFDRLTAPNPKDQVFKKKYMGNGIYNIFKNGKKVKTIDGEGEANAWINNAKKSLDEAGPFKGGNYIPGAEDIDFDVKSINMVYTDFGRFYGFNMYSEPGLKGQREKFSFRADVDDFLKSKGIKTEIPIGYDEDVLDSIVADFKKQGIEAEYGDHMDVSENKDKDDYGRSVSGKDKRTFVDPKDLTPAARAKKLAGMKEEKSKEDQLKVARAAFKKAEMDGDIRGQELALAAIDLIKGKRIKGLGKSSKLKETASELGYLNEITVSGGQEAARNYPPTENPGDMFAQKEVEDLLPASFASRNQELKARIQGHANWAKQDRFNNTFVHFQSNTVSDGNNIYRIAMSQHYNGNYTGFKNPRFTEIRVKELDNESDMERDLGKYVVDTTALMQDLRKLKTIERVS